MEKVYNAVRDLTAYGLAANLIEKEDVIYTVNSLLGALGIEDYPGNKAEIIRCAEEADPAQIADGTLLEGILEVILDYAAGKDMVDGSSVVMRDLFDTKIMGILTPRPSQVIAKFRKLYEDSPLAATDWYYRFSQNTDYIRRYRIARDRRWKSETPYGDLDIPITIQNGPWGFQYSPYVYYNEHCIVFNSLHIPMAINHNTFCKLFDFVKAFPHYFLGSNADLPIVGGSILSHDHFQGGHYDFAMAKAPVERTFTVDGFEDVGSGIVKWPMSCIRLSGPDTDRLIALADHILEVWRGYTDADAFIFANTEDTPHNTITPIARKRGDHYELDLVLRNNITTEEHPLGVYHPHAELHHIKKENIGLIEVMGMAILPARLLEEMDALSKAILAGSNLREDSMLEKHADWAEEFVSRYDQIDASNVDGIIRDEIGKVFAKVLEDAGVYKRTPQGQEAFDRFISAL